MRLDKLLAQQIIELIDKQTHKLLGAIQDGRVILGGSAGSAGGVGEPPIGFWGKLRQGRITYDTSAGSRACSTGSAGSDSLVDNLDRIRLGWDICGDAINEDHIDWGFGAGQVSAVDVPFATTSGSISATNVRDAIEETYSECYGGGDGVGPHDLLSATHPDTSGSSPPTRGSLIIAKDAAPDTKWQEYGLGTKGHFAKSDGTDTIVARFAGRVVNVGPDPSCEASTLGAAVDIINAAGSAGSYTPWGIMIWADYLNETGAVTIPAHVHVGGLGSTIDMGANSLSLSDNSSLSNVRVNATGSIGDHCGILIEDADCELFNVHAHLYGSYNGIAYCVLIDGDSACRLTHVTATATAPAGEGKRIGFQVTLGATAHVIMHDCVADDTDNFYYGLQLPDTACTVETHYCRFGSNFRDVYVDTAATWKYLDTEFDIDKCLVTGTARPADAQPVVYFPCTRTAGAAADFATIQAAIDWFKNRLLCATCKIDIVTGASYAEALVIEDVFCAAEGRLELEGDTRGMAGASWVDNATITCQDANAGSGTCALAGAAAQKDITVTGTGGNPDFDADGWGNGDKIFVRDNAGTITEYTIDSVLNNVITLTINLTNAVGNTGTSITLKPNTEIAPASAGNAVEVIASKGILLDGLHLDATAGATGNGLHVHNGGDVRLENVCIQFDDWGVGAQNSGANVIMDDGACTVIGGATGFFAEFGASIIAERAVRIGGVRASYIRFGGSLFAHYAVAAGCSSAGWQAVFFAAVYVMYAFALDCNDGFYAFHMGGMHANGSTAQQNAGNGYYAGYMGYVFAGVTSGNLAGNGTDYSPAPALPGSAQGNHYGVIYAS